MGSHWANLGGGVVVWEGYEASIGGHGMATLRWKENFVPVPGDNHSSSRKMFIEPLAALLRSPHWFCARVSTAPNFKDVSLCRLQ